MKGSCGPAGSSMEPADFVVSVILSGVVVGVSFLTIWLARIL